MSMTVNVIKSTLQPQNGLMDGVFQFTTEGTTASIDVTDVGFTNCTSVVYASASVVSGAATTTVPVPLVSWTTTNTTLKFTVSASYSTYVIGVRFVGK
jgi:hypothetical protein